jgi:hypothetical protein
MIITIESGAAVPLRNCHMTPLPFSLDQPYKQTTNLSFLVPTPCLPVHSCTTSLSHSPSRPWFSVPLPPLAVPEDQERGRSSTRKESTAQAIGGVHTRISTQ